MFTFDSATRKAFTTLVRNVGSKRHFNRIDSEGHDPNHIENALAEIEGEISSHLAEVIAARAFPSDDHFTSVMNLIAQVSVRNPRLRAMMEDYHRQIAQSLMSLAISSKEIWESQIRQMKEDGIPLNDNVTYEDMKKFHDERRYEILIDQTHLIGVEFEMLPTVLETLANRNWCFGYTESDNHYISSDDPVVLMWIDEDRRGHMPPGHGLKGTMITFPLSSSVVLMGAFEELPERIAHNDAQVVSVNTNVARYSTKQIYARDGSFRLNLRERHNVKGDDLPKYYGR